MVTASQKVILTANLPNFLMYLENVGIFSRCIGKARKRFTPRLRTGDAGQYRVRFHVQCVASAHNHFKNVIYSRILGLSSARALLRLLFGLVSIVCSLTWRHAENTFMYSFLSFC